MEGNTMTPKMEALVAAINTRTDMNLTAKWWFGNGGTVRLYVNYIKACDSKMKNRNCYLEFDDAAELVGGKVVANTPAAETYMGRPAFYEYLNLTDAAELAKFVAECAERDEYDGSIEN